MNTLIKNYILKKLEKYTQQFFAHNPSVNLIAVVGSAGKTTTKQAVATMLAAKFRVIASNSPRQDHLSVPLEILGIAFPKNPHSFAEWSNVLKLAKKRSKKDGLDAQIIVVELPSTKPGMMVHYGNYLNPDMTIITSVAADHMATFETLDAEAQEYLSVGAFSKAVIINRDDVSESYASLLEATDIDTYGMSGIAEFHFLVDKILEKGEVNGVMVTPQFGEQPMQLNVVGEHSVKPIVAATVVAVRLGMRDTDIKQGAEAVLPTKGRMQPLSGVNGSLLIDDTYSSSPLASIAALQTLYGLPNQQRIAVLGSMNDMGNYSKDAHEQVAFACDPSLLQWVVTIGGDAQKYLGVAAQGRGCQVKSFRSPIEAAAFVRSVIQPGAVVLLKGDVEAVYAEEAVKTLLAYSIDENRLVRQSSDWIAKKNLFLSNF